MFSNEVASNRVDNTGRCSKFIHCLFLWEECIRVSFKAQAANCSPASTSGQRNREENALIGEILLPWMDK